MRAEINAGGTTKVSVNDMLVKAIAQAHRTVPDMNVVWTEEAVRAFDSVDIAVAVATDNGLVTPVVRAVDRMPVSEVAETVRDYAERARAGRLQQHELEGGTISLTNLGMYGTEDFAAIINPPHSAILAVGNARREAVVGEEDLVEVATVLRVTLSVDHRPVDGVVAAQWMREFLALLESPARILA
jgi:pyruvate dehydrogenase E2 component (dihydrolipoamide acetyltransferase)